jgi:hypothetical protein
MKIFVYANCQGTAFKTFLPMIEAQVQVRHIENYRVLSGEVAVETFARDVEEADVIIYQPIGEQYGALSTAANGLLSIARAGCQLLSFPYLYNDALWPCIENDGTIINGSVIEDLLSAGASEDDVCAAYRNDELNFHFERRLENTLALLREREQETDVSICDFVIEHYQTNELFFTQNHPSTVLFLETIGQIAAKIWDRPTQLNANDFTPNYVNLPGRVPMSRFSIRDLRLTYQTEPDDGADEYFVELLKIHSRAWIDTRNMDAQTNRALESDS